MARMFGYENHLGHLTSSGTVANLEALWVARHLHPGKAIAFSAEARYTHSRMCEVIGAGTIEIAVDGRGRMDLDDLRARLKTGEVGTVVMTSGTTALGTVDPIGEAVELRREFEFRIHVDGAYGGFFKLLADANLLGREANAAFKAIASDSVVVDPHKHGLQPYGCGSVLFRDPSVGRFYKHDSPYTYFTSNELHEVCASKYRTSSTFFAPRHFVSCNSEQCRYDAVVDHAREAPDATARIVEDDGSAMGRI